jgi:hypothetical protein
MKWTHSVTFARPAIFSACTRIFRSALSFFVLLMPLVRRLGAEKSMNHLIVWPRVVILIAWMWVGLVVDQMPCFLGVPNCD